MSAQISERLTFSFGGGPTFPNAEAGERLNIGSNFSLSGGYKFTPQFGLNLDYQFNNFNINRTTLDALEQPDGTTRVWSLTLNPIYRINPEGKLSAYVTGGYGLYGRTIEFTKPTLADVIICDPWWGFCGPVTVPANEVIGSTSVLKSGVNVGGGIAYRLGESRAKIFVEGRAHRMFTSPEATVYTPLTFGIRFN